jgi:hypothetical protein
MVRAGVSAWSWRSLRACLVRFKLLSQTDLAAAGGDRKIGWCTTFSGTEAYEIIPPSPLPNTLLSSECERLVMLDYLIHLTY